MDYRASSKRRLVDRGLPAVEGEAGEVYISIIPVVHGVGELGS